MVLTGSMGCGGSRSAVVETRCYESRDTESTWLTSTDVEMQRPVAISISRSVERERKTATLSAEGKLVLVGRGSCTEKTLVNTGTQCGTDPRPAQEVTGQSKKTQENEGSKSVLVKTAVT